MSSSQYLAIDLGMADDSASPSVPQNDCASSGTILHRTRTGTPLPDGPGDDFPPLQSELDPFIVPKTPLTSVSDLGVSNTPGWLRELDAVTSLDDDSCVPHMRFLVCAHRNWSYRDPYWIMSPNMIHVPEQPDYSAAVSVMSDGRMGIHEWGDHPRNFLPFRPHEAVIRTDLSDADFTLFLSPLSKDDLQWDLQCPLGRFSLDLRIRLDTTFRRVADLINPRWIRPINPSVLPHDSKLHATVSYFYMMHRVHTWSNAITIFRHWQCCCRDLIAWNEWQEILDDMQSSRVPAKGPNISFRGVFTHDPLVVKLYAVLGIPVWYVSEVDKSPPLKRLVPIKLWKDISKASALEMPPADWKAPDLFRSYFNPRGGINIPYTPVNDILDFQIGIDSHRDRSKPSRTIRLGRALIAGANLDDHPPLFDRHVSATYYDWSGLEESLDNSPEDFVEDQPDLTARVGPSKHTLSSSESVSHRVDKRPRLMGYTGSEKSGKSETYARVSPTSTHVPSDGYWAQTRDIYNNRIWFPAPFIRVKRPELLKLPEAPVAVVPWFPVAIPAWMESGSTPLISESRQVELFTSLRLEVDHNLGQMVPPPSIFSSAGHRSLYLYNWVLLSPTFYYQFEANPIAEVAYQNTQAWRHTLSGRTNPSDKKNWYVGPDFGLAHCVSQLPLGTWNLTWRDCPIVDENRLNDVQFLSALMWELSEALFLYSFIMLDHRIVQSDCHWISVRHLVFINWWTGGYSILPEFHNERAVDDDRMWRSQVVSFCGMVNLMRLWPGFPLALEGPEIFSDLTFSKFDGIRKRAISFYLQTYADHFSRPPPLPCIRPPFPF